MSSSSFPAINLPANTVVDLSKDSSSSCEIDVVSCSANRYSKNRNSFPIQLVQPAFLKSPHQLVSSGKKSKASSFLIEELLKPDVTENTVSGEKGKSGKINLNNESAVKADVGGTGVNVKEVK